MNQPKSTKVLDYLKMCMKQELRFRSTTPDSREAILDLLQLGGFVTPTLQKLEIHIQQGMLALNPLGTPIRNDIIGLTVKEENILLMMQVLHKKDVWQYVITSVEALIYIAEDGTGYTERQIREQVDSALINNPILAPLLTFPDDNVAAQVLYDYVMGLLEWEHPNTILDQIDEEDVEVLLERVEQRFEHGSKQVEKQRDLKNDLVLCQRINKFLDQTDLQIRIDSNASEDEVDAFVEFAVTAAKGWERAIQRAINAEQKLAEIQKMVNAHMEHPSIFLIDPTKL